MSHVTRTVYGIYYPETRRIVDALWAERPHAWYEQNYTGRQDSMHLACMQRWRAWVSVAGVTLGSGYAHEYPTAGANEAIHALLAQHVASGGGRIHVFAGEYEGYIHLAEGLGLRVFIHPRDEGQYAASISGAARPGDLFWISQPSAIDGNLWDGFAAFRDWMKERARGVNLVVDLTYVGAVPSESRVDLDHDNVAAVVWSLSKPFGVYYHRIGGVVTRTPVATLRGHHWFKNLFSVHLGERLMAAHPASELPSRYRTLQSEVLERSIAAGEASALARPSGVVMLAHAPAGDTFGEYARGAGQRFCLSPGIDRAIRGASHEPS